MNDVQLVDFNQQDWSDHPTIPGVAVKLFQPDASGSPEDLLIARVEPGGTIPWHVHSTVEIAYFLQGTGSLSTSATEARDQVHAVAVAGGTGLVVPAGVWHSLQNTGDDTLLVFALHTS
jgi:mannose-6-phosphate isomerase-like protein (cupin superfamily)